MKSAFYSGVTLMIALLLSVFISPDSAFAADDGEAKLEKTVVEVYYFHRTRRCGPCRTIQNLTQQTMEEHFAQAMENGEVVFHIVNVQSPENEETAKKFSAMSTALHINVIDADGEESQNLTGFAYRHSRNADDFIAGLKEHVEKGLGKH